MKGTEIRGIARCSAGMRARAVLAAALVLAALPAGGRQAAAREDHRQLMTGVDHVRMVRPDPLIVNLARVRPGAEVDLKVVPALDRVGGQDSTGRELTSGACARLGGLVCVNGDYTLCPQCGQPYGGVARDGRVLRSFREDHEQFSQTATGYTADRPRWSGQLVATYTWREPPSLGGALLGEEPPVRSEARVLPLGGLNLPRPADGSVLYTPDWADTTQAAGGLEVQLATTGPVRPGAVDARFVTRGDAGGTPIPAQHAVVSSAGSAAGELARFWDEWHASDADEKRLVVETAVSIPVVQSVGGHPVLLRAGAVQHMDGSDPKVRDRHPRTLVGWNPQGELLLVVIDGRRPGRSTGLTLPEAAHLMKELGATDAVNLDGGGSSTFVGPCPAGPCVLNEPSDGRERTVSTVVALVPRTVVAAPAPPQPLPATVAAPPPALVAPEADPASTPAPAPAAPPPAPAPAPAPAPPVVEPAPAPEVVAPPDVVAPAEPRAGGRGARPSRPAPATSDSLPALPVALASALLLAVLAAQAAAWRRSRPAHS